MRKILLAFDFDHTIIDENSDTYIRSLCAGGEVPADLKKIYKESGWTAYMQAIFVHLHLHNVSKEDLLNCVQKIPLTPMMGNFLQNIPKEKVDCIIISDSNTIFIDRILKQQNLVDIFDKIFTNPAEFDDSGLLKIDVYHHQDWCSLSAANICKGRVLIDFVEEKQSSGLEYTHIGYIGDGTNDFCPSLCLREPDTVFPRQCYSLERFIKSKEKEGLHLTANMQLWQSAIDIDAVVTEWCNKIEQDDIPTDSRLLPLQPKLVSII